MALRPGDLKATERRQRTKNLANSLPCPVSKESEEVVGSEDYRHPDGHLIPAAVIGPQRKALAGARAPAERDVWLQSKHTRDENASGGHATPALGGGRPMSAPAMSPLARRPAFPHPQNRCVRLRSPTR
jgi:hypothetical protein